MAEPLLLMTERAPDRRPARLPRAVLVMLLLVCGVLACDDGVVDRAALPAFTLSSGHVGLVEGAEARFAVQWHGTPPPEARVEWSVVPPSLGTVDAGGTFRAGTPGSGVYTATVRSALGAQARSASLLVVARYCGLLTVLPGQGSLAVGGRLQLRSHTLGGGSCERRDSADVTYRTLDAAIASVDSMGLVRGLRIGVTVVLVSLRADPTVTVPVQITVLLPAGDRSSVVVDPPSLAMMAGDTARVRGTASLRSDTPPAARSVTFGGGDPRIAAVDTTGLVRAVSVGRTSIVARSTADSAIWVAVPVTVRAP